MFPSPLNKSDCLGVENNDAGPFLSGVHGKFAYPIGTKLIIGISEIICRSNARRIDLPFETNTSVVSWS